MMSFPLTLRFSARCSQSPAAWFISGDDPAHWLTLLSTALPETVPFDLFPIPKSRGDRSTLGILIIPADSTRCHPSPLMLACYRRGSLYLPVASEVWPPVSDAELAKTLSCQINFMHPTVGLVGFSRDESIPLPQLLAYPTRREVNWSCARPGVDAPARLIAVLPLRQPDIQSILNEGRDDIGRNPPNTAPPSPKEPSASPILKAAATAPLSALSVALQKIAAYLQSKPPAHSSPPPTAEPGTSQSANSSDSRTSPAHQSLASRLSNMLGDVAAQGAKILRDLTPKQFESLAASLEFNRNRELNRLLSLLQNNPDEGLRYALPLGGTPGRGLTMPTDRLSPRDTNFTMSGIGGGGPADPWNLTSEMREQLRANYRRLATREIQLGRYRRAAYIFGELLGDFAAAANALKQGRHYREAAILYRERLNNKLAAAECLCEGGLPLEAIPLYEELDMFERAAELYAQLEQPVEAASCYRKAVQLNLQRQEVLKAAALLENKLSAPQEALDILDAAWPHGRQAAPCLTEAFHLLGRLKDHAGAKTRISRLRTSTVPSDILTPMATVLANVATTFPEESTRKLAADSTRVVVGNAIRTAGTPQARALTDLLPQLTPADLLLPRDGQRFVRSILKPPAKPAQLARSSTSSVLGNFTMTASLQRQFNLPPASEWQQFISAGPLFYAIDSRTGTLLQSDWKGTIALSPQKTPVPAPFLLAYSHNPPRLMAEGITVAQPLDNPDFAQREGSDAVQVASSFLPANPFGLACDEEGNAWALHLENSSTLDMVLSVFDTADRRLVATHAVESPPTPDVEMKLPLPMVVRANHAYFAFDTSIVILAYGRSWETLAMPHRVTHMVASHSLTRARVAAGMESGGVVFTDGTVNYPVAEALDFPLLCFSRGGMLVAVAKSAIRIYRMSGTRPEHVGTIPGHGFDASSPGSAVLPTDHLDEIALVSPSGKIQILRLTKT